MEWPARLPPVGGGGVSTIDHRKMKKEEQKGM